jgi:hypothetical protein
MVFSPISTSSAAFIRHWLARTDHVASDLRGTTSMRIMLELERITGSLRNGGTAFVNTKFCGVSVFRLSGGSQRTIRVATQTRLTSDKSGGLNGWTQHLLEADQQGFQQLRIVRER